MSQEDIGSCSKLLNFYNYLIHLRNGPRLVTRAGQAFRAEKLRKSFEQSDRFTETNHAPSTVSFVAEPSPRGEAGSNDGRARPLPQPSTVCGR